ncbi:MAG: glycosyltransferase [Herpetosiphon sp.]|nr:glycosyltransferase [Herpetosiphon sp.]
MNQPLVSIIVVNFNGKHHLEACLKSLLHQTYPTEKLEILLIDNNSHDGSREFITQYFPSVRLIHNQTNRGFASAVNQGAKLANGQYIALINNDAYADPQWIATLVSTMQTHREQNVVCVGAKMLDWYGKKIDFIEGGINFYGHGVQIFAHVPVESLDIKQHEILFACGGAMLIDRKVFLDVGGFDDDYFAYFEDVDLGWRLWVFGYRVLFEPQAIIYHRHHGTANRMYYHQVHMLSERNALLTILKNYDDTHLQRILPTSLFLLIERSLLDMDYTAHRRLFDLREKGQHHDDGMITIPKVALSKLMAVGDVLDQFGHVWEKRQTIQAQRKRPDADILPLFKRPMDVSHLSATYAWLQSTLTDAFEVRSMFQPNRITRVLIVSSDALYENLAGVGMRAVEMARHLAPYCHVTLAAPEQAKVTISDVQCVSFDRHDAETLRQLGMYAEVILVHGYTLFHYPMLKDLHKILIVDVYDPFHLENLELQHKAIIESGAERAMLDVHIINDQLMAADFLVCASERQRDFWLGALGSIGRLSPEHYQEDPTFRSLIDVVSFGCNPVPPVHERAVIKGVVSGIESNDTLLLWGGGIWDWLDPLTVIRAMAHVVNQRTDIKLFFMGAHHPNPTIVPHMPMYDRAVALAQELGLHNKFVFFNDHWVAYNDRANYLLEADIGLSAHFEHVETRFAFRTRLLDYIWAGLPMIVSDGDTLADTVRELDLGRVVAVDDVSAYAEAILDLAMQPNRRVAFAPAFAHAQERYRWDQTLKPLIEFCQHPHYAKDRARLTTQPVQQPSGDFSHLHQRISELETIINQKNDHILHLQEMIKRLEHGRVMQGLQKVQKLRARLGKKG